MATFVLEIGCEEMPARFVPSMVAEIKQGISALLTEAKIGFGDVDAYATPRRVAVLVADVMETQPEEIETVSGPPVRIAYDADGNPTKACEGFAKTQGVDVADLFTLETKKGEYIAAKVKTGGANTLDVLPDMCREMVEKLNFPKKMRWGSRDFAFGRPIPWLLALLGSDVVRFKIEDIEAGRITRGHRVMGPGPFEIGHAADYLDVIREKGKVIIDPEERKRMVVEQGDKLAAEKGGKVVWKDSLLDEVSNLVEYPKPIIGDFDPSFLELPREVLLTSMESHQKSFGLEGDDGKLLPHFLTTLNLEPKDVELVRLGWERVLKARLEDARFFWNVDTKVEFSAWLETLDKVTFIGPIGTMGDKARRMEKLCGILAETGASDIKKYAVEAGLLAKADLVSEMVNEFDSLQGKMGGIYGRKAGLPEETCRAIYEQYLPAGPDSPVPSTPTGALVSMADKADTLAGCFGLSMIPTGAADPYALRRCALGICRIIIEHGLNLDLKDILSAAQAGYAEGIKWKLEQGEAFDKLMEFFAQRIRAYFTGQGFATKIVDAACGAGFTDVRTLKARIEALDEFSKAEDFDQAVLTFKRAANIIRKQGEEAGQELTGSYDAAALKEDQEKGLAEKIQETAPKFDELWAKDDFAGLLGLLRELRPAVDDFFDNVMVMSEDPAERLNRLNLLQALVGMLGRLADFNALQV